MLVTLLCKTAVDSIMTVTSTLTVTATSLNAFVLYVPTLVVGPLYYSYCVNYHCDSFSYQPSAINKETETRSIFVTCSRPHNYSVTELWLRPL